MRLAAYALVLSGLYAILAVLSDQVAQALTIAFVAMLVIPACFDIHKSLRSKRRSTS